MKLKEFFYMPRTDRRSFMCLAVLLLVVAVSMMILSCPSGSNDVTKADKGDSIANAEQGAVSLSLPMQTVIQMTISPNVRSRHSSSTLTQPTH